jgi:hypothetical protein
LTSAREASSFDFVSEWNKFEEKKPKRRNMDKAHDIQKVEFIGTTMLLQVDGKKYEIEISVWLNDSGWQRRTRGSDSRCLRQDMGFIGRMSMRICPLTV